MGVNSVISYVRHKPVYKEFHRSDIIKSPIIITPEHIALGEHVYIGYHARIEGIEEYEGERFNPTIKICYGVSIQQNLHLTCANYICIGENTAIAANVTITDIHHPYEDVDMPIERQKLVVKEVVMGADCKIFNNVVVLPGVHIGKHVTIGANSVVTHDIPAYSVAVGCPAKVIRYYDFKNNQWTNVK